MAVVNSPSQGVRILSASHDGLVGELPLIAEIGYFHQVQFNTRFSVRWSVEGREMINVTGECHTNQVQALASNKHGLVASIGMDDTLRILNSSLDSYV